MELLVRDFQKRFHASPQVVTRAPGRLEILGNHTDYNEGVTLSCAINLATYVAIRKNGSMMMRLADVKLPNELHEIPLDPLPPPTPGDWTNYIRGVVQALQKRNYRLEGFDLLLVSELPLSSGMSSSAALEIATAYAIGDLFRIQLPPKEWAKIGQEAENLYVGAKTGLLDQFSSIFGKENSLVFCDFRSLEVETCPVPIGTKLIIAHSGVKHNLTMEYNERRSRCEEAARTIGVRALRDVSLEILNQWKNRLHPVTYRRALHVVGENERVFQAMEVLKKNDLQAFGLLLLASHQSS
ncbi:MAG: galactokinase, partial [Candidatus Bathyarchaeia archaeon]